MRRFDANASARRQLMGMSKYKPGKTSDADDAIRLSANENSFGTASCVIDAIRDALDRPGALNRYANITCEPLRDALASIYGMSADHFLFGNGLDDVITMLATAFIDEGDEVIVPTATFGVYEGDCAVMGASIRRMPMRDDLSIDIPGMERAMSDRTKMIWICSPNNPTGLLARADEFESLARAAAAMDRPPIIAVDQAYIDFAELGSGDLDASTMVERYGNVVVLRTFSKISGLAAIRAGYAVASPDVISIIYSVRPPYTVNALAQAAVLADLTDPRAEKFRRDVKASVLASRRKLESFLGSRGVRYVPSQSNFVFAFYDKEYEWLAELSSKLVERNIYIRTLKHRDAPHGIRLSIGTPEENDKLITALDEILRS